MSKKTTKTERFYKMVRPFLESLRALGGFARPKEITKRIVETWKTFSSKCIFNY